MAQKRFEGFLARNEKYVETYTPLPKLKTLVENMPSDHGGIFILTCADSRVVPDDIFGLSRGEASIIRNAGGRAADAFRSLEVMGSIGRIGLVVVMHHTGQFFDVRKCREADDGGGDCGGLFTTDDEVREKLANRAPQHASTIKDKWFGTFQSAGLDESIRQDVAAIRAWPFLPVQAKVVGYAFEVETGWVREVVGL